MKRAAERLSLTRRGQSLVELALMLPVCLWIMLGIVDFGRVYFFSTSMTNAAREGARYWVLNPSATSTQVKDRVQAEGSPQVTLDSALITLSSPSFELRQISIQYNFTPLTPMISSLVPGGTFALATQATMPVMTN